MVILTSALTIIGGVIVFAAGKLLSQLLLDPVQALRRVISQTAGDLVFLGNVYGNPGTAPEKERNEASVKLRTRSSELVACGTEIIYYNLPARLGWIPKFGDLITAQKHLIGLSNSCHQIGGAVDNDQQRKKIQDALGIHEALR